MIYSTGGIYADLQYNDGQYFLYRHLIHMLVGLVSMTVAVIVNYHHWQKYSIWLMLGILVLLILLITITFLKALIFVLFIKGIGEIILLKS